MPHRNISVSRHLPLHRHTHSPTRCPAAPSVCFSSLHHYIIPHFIKKVYPFQADFFAPPQISAKALEKISQKYPNWVAYCSPAEGEGTIRKNSHFVSSAIHIKIGSQKSFIFNNNALFFKCTFNFIGKLSIINRKFFKGIHVTNIISYLLIWMR